MMSKETANDIIETVNWIPVNMISPDGSSYRDGEIYWNVTYRYGYRTVEVDKKNPNDPKIKDYQSTLIPTGILKGTS